MKSFVGIEESFDQEKETTKQTSKKPKKKKDRISSPNSKTVLQTRRPKSV
jgi:hypothetical protein